MPRGKLLTPEQVGAVQALHHAGKSNRYIARTIGCSEKAIRTCLARDAQPKPPKRVGRKPKVTKRMLRRIFRMATIKQYSSKRIADALDNKIKPSTVRQWLRSTKLVKYIKRKPRPSLKLHHKKARTKFAAEWMIKSHLWHRIVFSD
ncbi:hypothetical protein AaE_015726 [Aphanomyces astaci]|uniref:Transposase Tc1-like domain-containing protein n=1 Tax=Aphanomyces astaci TaxID=112090 RepID=A0A6A4Z0S4_APHAT|nr:hypothetical protein AaE_015726 [Aphanomyces astaci]